MLISFYVVLLYLSSFAHARTLPPPQTITIEAKKRWLEGDSNGVISLLEPWMNEKSNTSGDEKDALRLLLAKAYEAEHNWHAAQAQYAIVRNHGKTLSAYATLQEPNAALEAKDFATAKKRCDAITRKEVDSDVGNACLITSAIAAGEMGYIKTTESLFYKYMNIYPSSPYKESFSLKQAEYTYRVNKQNGYILLYNLYFHHSYPTTDISIQKILGAPIPITNLSERSARIKSFIRGNRLQEAWDLFTEIYNKPEKTTEEKQWTEESVRDVSWRTRKFTEYIAVIEKDYQQDPSSENAYKIFRAHTKAGQWTEAADFAVASLKKFGNIGRWAGAKEDVARALMFAERYTEAANMWSSMSGNDAKFYTAFSWYMSEDYLTAAEKLTTISNSNSPWNAAASYWLGKTQQRLHQDPSMAFNRAIIEDSSGWYTLLIEQQLHPEKYNTTNHSDASSSVQQIHKGVWPELHRIQLQDVWPNGTSITDTPQVASQISVRALLNKTYNWSTFTTPNSASIVSSTNIWTTSSYKRSYPNSYDNTVLGTEENWRSVFGYFIDQYNTIFPNLLETHYLALVGLYPEASRNMQSNYTAWETNKQPAIGMDVWRAVFLYTRAHHYVLRYTSGMAKHFTEPEQIREIRQLNYPIVRPQYIWEYTEQYDVDPWLMLGLMRQESSYRETVQSWVGAIGYIQVMPATGAKLAYLLHKDSYSPKDLENPQINLEYGIFYFSKLMERFDNAYPLAVGSYNGGPHNMSRWYRSRMNTWKMDEFIEHIPYDETRQYVKKVTGNYAKYVGLYLPEDMMYIPNAPLKDDASVIDF